MPVKKSGLGKGLDSLIPNKNVKSAKPSVKADEKKATPKEEILEAGPIMVKINKVEQIGSSRGKILMKMH